MAFVDEEDEDEEEVKKNNEIAGEVKKGEEANIVNIVVRNLVQKYSDDAKVLKRAKAILEDSKDVP